MIAVPPVEPAKLTEQVAVVELKGDTEQLVGAKLPVAVLVFSRLKLTVPVGVVGLDDLEMTEA